MRAAVIYRIIFACAWQCKAKEANMPNENINRAIQKGTGEQDGTNYESFSYEVMGLKE